jgi:hypothetical protein
VNQFRANAEKRSGTQMADGKTKRSIEIAVRLG